MGTPLRAPQQNYHLLKSRCPIQDLPLLKPHSITLHAGISRILHMSGAAQVFSQILEKYDRAAGDSAGILKSNGNSVHKLSSMISVLYMGASLIVKYLSLAPRNHVDFVAALLVVYRSTKKT
ncbi:hypothetical protein K503DRAFT_553211 [Rhizopogon vinicolor AM-OR11-026]|uniref:Uncharacterized protein n=1 Tax=Rhizopogon vinicolor AM-OR11-026 TaxID=1314800 RepID=A0A1B7MKH9_9AGAM|nr:hypothetical protein K503DRAFT_553211 [Rhizopogon vinicolor AM-OR11-026]